MRRFSIILTSVLTLSLLSPFGTSAFSDVNNTTPYATAIRALKTDGIVKGDDNTGNFRAWDTLNRAELVKIVLEGRGRDETFRGSNCFDDVTNEWFAPYVCTAKEEGIVSGYPGTNLFKPSQAVTFVEASKIFALAFEQSVQGGGEWYEPFGRALETSQAIPPTIDALDRPLTRGEMAEILWRIREQKTDQPSKGLLNVQHADLGVNTATTAVQTATSCRDLQLLAKRNHYRAMPMMMEMAADSAGGTTGGMQAKSARVANDDFSATNTQVAGVDEGDIVKTDGTHVFIARNSEVTIVRALPSNEMDTIARIKLGNTSLERGAVFEDKELAKLSIAPSSNFHVTDLYLADDKLIVLGQQHSYSAYPTPMPINSRIAVDAIYPPMQSTQQMSVKIYDISLPSAPKELRTVSIDGHNISSRRIDDMLYLVTQKHLPWFAPGEFPADTLLPRMTDTAVSSTSIPVANCNDVRILPRVQTPSFITVAAIPLSTTGKVDRSVIVGQGDTVFMSQQNLFVSSQEWNYNWRPGFTTSTQQTRVHRFNVTPRGLEFRAQGTVPGRILNQFSMDEFDNHFRIATTIDGNWTPNGQTPSTNNLYVLNMDMERTGEITDIAPGESIFSVRFMGERTYMVTFKKIDPLFVIDTSDHTNPRILGKLKIPGFSDYLHPYDRNHIIGFGKDAVEAKEGDFAWFQGMKIALFDVSDVANPKELHQTIIGDRGTSSELLRNHKALLFDKERDLLAFPIQVHKIPEDQLGKDNAYGSPVFQGAYVYNLTPENGFVLEGTITHYDQEDFLKAGDYWYDRGHNISRILRLSSDLITISNSTVQSHNLSTVSLQGKTDLPPLSE